MQMPNLNEQILNHGVDEEVIDAQVIDQPVAKKKKMVRLLSILGFGLIAGGGYMMYTDQKPQQSVNSELQRILSGAEKHPPKAVPPATQTQSLPTPLPQSPEQQISGSKPSEEQKPAAVASVTTTPSQPAAASTPTLSTPAVPAVAATAQAKPPAVESKPLVPPAQSDKEILWEKKVEHLIGTVETLKKQVAQLSSRATAAPATAAAVPKKQITPVAATNLPIKTINLKESGILATTVNSLIVFYGGKNQEIFVGDIIPGMGEKLASTNPHAREFTTSRAIYRPGN